MDFDFNCIKCNCRNDCDGNYVNRHDVTNLINIYGGVKMDVWEWILILIVSSAIAGMIAMAIMLIGMM